MSEGAKELRELPSRAEIGNRQRDSSVGCGARACRCRSSRGYGIDPTGIGRMLGLTALSGAAVVEAVPPPQGDGLAPEIDGMVTLYPGRYRVDSRTFTLGPNQYLEYKYRLAKDASMLFSWKASGDVVHDFHGDPDGAAAMRLSHTTRRRAARPTAASRRPSRNSWMGQLENPGGETIAVQVQAQVSTPRHTSSTSIARATAARSALSMRLRSKMRKEMSDEDVDGRDGIGNCAGSCRSAGVRAR